MKVYVTMDTAYAEHWFFKNEIEEMYMKEDDIPPNKCKLTMHFSQVPDEDITITAWGNPNLFPSLFTPCSVRVEGRGKVVEGVVVLADEDPVFFDKVIKEIPEAHIPVAALNVSLIGAGVYPGGPGRPSILMSWQGLTSLVVGILTDVASALEGDEADNIGATGAALTGNAKLMKDKKKRKESGGG